MKSQNLLLRLALASAALVIAAGCVDRNSTAPDAVVSTADSAPSNATQGALRGKTTAPIDMDYEIRGTPTIGEPLTIDVYLAPTVAVGEMRVMINAGEAIELMRPDGRILMSFPKAGTSQVHSITLVPRQEGRFYVGVVASVVIGGVEQARAFSIPVQVGDSTERVLEESNGRLTQDEEGNPVVSLPADDRGQ